MKKQVVFGAPLKDLGSSPLSCRCTGSSSLILGFWSARGLVLDRYSEDAPLGEAFIKEEPPASLGGV